jgi:hypothetical protein
VAKARQPVGVCDPQASHAFSAAIYGISFCGMAGVCIVGMVAARRFVALWVRLVSSLIAFVLGLAAYFTMTFVVSCVLQADMARWLRNVRFAPDNGHVAD